MFYYLFFFSSRRRHTRWPRDWSSDVCSSDLNVGFRPVNVGTSRELTLYIQEKQDFSEELLALKEALFEALLEQLGGILPTPLVEVRQDENQGLDRKSVV